MLIPALYQAVETLHIFIPVLAILACVIIFACGMRSSKSAQPTEEYLSEIKAKTKQKTKNIKIPSTNSSKSLEKHSPTSGASEKQSNQKTTNAKADEKKAEVVNESPKKAPTKSPKHAPTKTSNFAENLPKIGSDSPQNSAWVTVSSKRGRKEMKEAQPVKNGNVVQPVVSPVAVHQQQQQHNRKSSEGTSPDKRTSISADDFEARNDVVAVDPEDAEEAWLMGKDSRYRKSKRGKGQEKEAALETSGPTSEKVNAGNGNINDFIPVDNTRKRRNVRRDN